LSNKDFLVNREDWSLHRKGHEDQKRHQEKIKEIMKENLPDMIAEEAIIMGNGESKVKIPIKSLNQYKIIYNSKKMQHTGMGNGDSQVGDTIARDEGEDEGKNASNGEKNGGGEMPGEDIYEAEISLADMEEELFQDLELPNLEKKQAGVMEANSYEFNDIGRIGITGNIHKKKTLMAAFKRNALNGASSFYPVKPEDVRYRTWNDVKKPDTRALIICMMDTSGSMGIWEKYMARSIIFWIRRFLQTKYEKVEIEFIAHHTEAKIVNEDDFFHRGESGGTICSSAYRKALQLIDEKYPPSQYNIFSFYTSDGDNLTSDNGRCVKLVEKLMEKSNLFGYLEVNQYNRHSTLMAAFKHIKNDKFKYYVMKQKEDVFKAFKMLFRKEETKNEYWKKN
jgi:sporulation protein YhbH